MNNKKIGQENLINIEDIIKSEMSKRKFRGEDSLVALKNSILDVTFDLISLVDSNININDGFDTLLDKLDKYSDLGFLGKVVFYSKYINTIIQLFNDNNSYGLSIRDYTIPKYKEKSEIKVFGEEIVFIHGYNDENSGKEDTILLFDFIDKNYIKESNNVKIKK